jgi:hypothetical protein
MKKLATAAALIIASLQARAADFHHGYITQVGVKGNGDVFIEFAEAVGQSQCNHPQVSIPASNPAAKDLLAVALAAYLSNVRVYIQTDSCFGAFPSMSGAGSWLYPKP